MITVVLESADNGIIKTVKDNNINGAGASFESKNVYDFNVDVSHNRKIEFFYELARDLGVDVGNIYKPNNLIMSVDWGSNYRPTSEELKYKIESFKLRLKQLENEYRQLNK
jgi:hypothetical protein